MSKEEFLIYGDICQCVTILLTLLAYFPLWRSIKASKPPVIMNIIPWLVWLLSASMAWVYAAIQWSTYGVAQLLLASTSFMLLFNLYTVLLLSLKKVRSSSFY